MADARWYGSVAAAKEVGISLRQCYYWVDVLRIVRPRIQQCGMRRFRRFTAADLGVLRGVKESVAQGYTLQAAARKARGRGVDLRMSANIKEEGYET